MSHLSKLSSQKLPFNEACLLRLEAEICLNQLHNAFQEFVISANKANNYKMFLWKYYKEMKNLEAQL